MVILDVTVSEFISGQFVVLAQDADPEWTARGKDTFLLTYQCDFDALLFSILPLTLTKYVTRSDNSDMASGEDGVLDSDFVSDFVIDNGQFHNITKQADDMDIDSDSDSGSDRVTEKETYFKHTLKKIWYAGVTSFYAISNYQIVLIEASETKKTIKVLLDIDPVLIEKDTKIGSKMQARK